MTPVNAASSKGHLEVVKLLLDKGADITLAKNDGWTPLHTASLNSHLKVVKPLLEKGADITIKNEGGATPLITAAPGGYLDIANLLPEGGADFTSSCHKETPLSFASHSARVKFNVRDRTDRTPIFYAVADGHREVVKLLSHSSVNTKDRYGATPLFAAVRNGHEEVVEQLITSVGPPSDLWDGLGQNLTWWAAGTGKYRIIELVRNYTQKLGVQVLADGDDKQCSLVNLDKGGRLCDVCIRPVQNDTYLRCEHCKNSTYVCSA